jgi:hypothetical protein
VHSAEVKVRVHSYPVDSVCRRLGRARASRGDIVHAISVCAKSGSFRVDRNSPYRSRCTLFLSFFLLALVSTIRRLPTSQPQPRPRRRVTRDERWPRKVVDHRCHGRPVPHRSAPYPGTVPESRSLLKLQKSTGTVQWIGCGDRHARIFRTAIDGNSLAVQAVITAQYRRRSIAPAQCRGGSCGPSWTPTERWGVAGNGFESYSPE